MEIGGEVRGWGREAVKYEVKWDEEWGGRGEGEHRASRREWWLARVFLEPRMSHPGVKEGGGPLVIVQKKVEAHLVGNTKKLHKTEQDRDSYCYSSAVVY